MLENEVWVEGTVIKKTASAVFLWEEVLRMPVLTPEVKVIRLYGVLGATFGHVHRLAVDSPQEAIKALCTVIPGLHSC